MPAMFAADADFQFRVGLAAFCHRNFHHLSDALDVQHLERIVFQNAGLVVSGQKFIFRIFATERERGLGQVVGAEREEFGSFCHATCANTGAHHFQHGAELEFHVDAVGRVHFLVDTLHITMDALEFFHRSHLRHHDLGIDFDPFIGAQGRSFENRAYLHRIDFRISDTQTHAAMAQHRVDLGQCPDFFQDHFLLVDDILFQMRFLEFVQSAHQLGQSVGILLVELWVEQLERFRQFFQALDGVAQLVQVCDFQFELCGGRQEFVHRRIEQAHGDRQSFHRLEDALEVGTLDRQQAIQ